MNEHPYMPLFYGDLLRQTAFWTGEERALLIVLWATEWWNGPLPLDLAALARGVNYDEKTFAALWTGRLHTLFAKTADGYIHEELEARRRAVAQISGARRSAGKASGEARRARASRRDDLEPSGDDDLLEHNSEQAVRTNGRTNGHAFDRTPIQSNPIQSIPVHSKPRPEPPISEAGSAAPASATPVPPSVVPPPAAATSTKGKGATPVRRRRIPVDHPTEPLRSWALENTPHINFDAEVAHLRDYEFRTPRSDWDAVVRNWLRKAAKEQARARGGDRLTRFERHKRRLYGEQG